MAVLEIDGVGKVEVGNDFLSLAPDRQAAEVDAIKAAMNPTTPAAPGMVSDEDLSRAAINANQPKPDTLAKRGSVLPLGRDQEGNLVAAVPGAIEGPRQTIDDLLTGRRGADQITPQEILELGLLLGGQAAGGAAGTGRGIAAAAAERAAPVAEQAVPAAERALMAPKAAAPEPVPPAPPTITPKPQTTEQFYDASKAFYRKVDDAGVTISGKALRPVINDIVSAAQKGGLDDILTPDSSRALKRLSEAVKQPVPFSEFDTLTQIVGIAKGATRTQDRAIAQKISEKLDDFIENLTSKDVISGDANVVSEFLPKAKDLWSRYRKLETVETMVDRARTSAPNFSASGFENALRTEFRSLAKNQRAMRKFTMEEREAIKRVARGGPLENTARNVGRFAPTGPVSAGLGLPSLAAAGAAIGGPIGSAVLVGGGAATAFLARNLAQKLTQRNIGALQKIIREGGDSDIATQAVQRGTKLLTVLTEAEARSGAGQNIPDQRKPVLALPAPK